MKTELVITDVTRMQEGRVCIAGYDRKKNCIRPVLPSPGIHETSLYADGNPIIFPFAVIELDLLESFSQPPHTEDYKFDPASVRFVKAMTEDEKRTTLDRLCEPTVSGIFNLPIHSNFGFYVFDGRGQRSLGTICPRQVTEVSYTKKADRWDYHLSFCDDETNYRLGVTDLTWRCYCDAKRQAGKSPEQISSELLSNLNAGKTFLRIGLARGWIKFPERCYLQITGVYTFPDYADGQTFADSNKIAESQSDSVSTFDRNANAFHPAYPELLSLENITTKIDRLAETQVAAEQAKADYETKRAQILAKVQLELDALDAEYLPLMELSSENANQMIAEIKNDVLRHGASVRSGNVQAIYSKGRVSWDSKSLGKYALGHPDILEYRKQGEPTVSIRYVKQRA